MQRIMGFWYKGIYSCSLGVYWCPSIEELGDDMEPYQVAETQTGASGGSYRVGTKLQPREFKLSCYFEDLTEFQRAQIVKWLDKDEGGDLI